MSKKKTATIYDVASAVGVSPSTVSRAFSNPARVSTDTAERIFAAARDLGFRTSGAAYASSDKATRVLCLVVADISNPTFAAMYKGFHKAAHEHGYAVVIANSDESGALEAHTLRRVLPDVDGVALAASAYPGCDSSGGEEQTVGIDEPLLGRPHVRGARYERRYYGGLP